MIFILEGKEFVIDENLEENNKNLDELNKKLLKF